jgi:Protein of unknown function (DUF1257)
MSHISKIELEVKDLTVLSQACTRLGLEFIKGQKEFKWYGKDAPCDHVVKVPDADYEIGVIKDKHRYELNCDYYDSSIEKAVGRQGGLLKQAYAVAKTKIEARRKGYCVLEKCTDTGVRLHIRINQ